MKVFRNIKKFAGFDNHKTNEIPQTKYVRIK